MGVPLISLAPTTNDDPEFVSLMQSTISGTVRAHLIPSVLVIRIDGWFGPKWLGFTGKVLGAVGVWASTLSVPPFVLNRVASQRRFTREDEQAYVEVDPGPPLHVSQPSGDNLQRSFNEILPGTACFWYSGDSAETARGSLLCYLPKEASQLPWYAGFKRTDHWKPTIHRNISASELRSLSLG